MGRSDSDGGISSVLRDLAKSATDRRVAGVCGGFGEHTEVPSWLWRVLFVTLAFVGGTGLVAYVALWVYMPNARVDQSQQT